MFIQLDIYTGLFQWQTFFQTLSIQQDKNYVILLLKLFAAIASSCEIEQSAP